MSKTTKTETQAEDTAKAPSDPGAGDDWVRDVLAAERELQERDEWVMQGVADVEEAKAALKHAEKKREQAVRHLRDAIHNRGQKKLPFSEEEMDSTVPVAEALEDEPNPAIKLHPEPDLLEDWKMTPVSMLEITEAAVKKLEDAELATIGDIAAFTATKRLTDIKGIGDKAADKIETALESFWARRRATGLPENVAPDVDIGMTPDAALDADVDAALAEEGETQ